MPQRISPGAVPSTAMPPYTLRLPVAVQEQIARLAANASLPMSTWVRLYLTARADLARDPLLPNRCS